MESEPFTTDGCSGGMTRGWRLVLKADPPWQDLCVEHDRAYWQGGTRQCRRKADLALMAGITLRGWPLLALAMYLAVRVGGHPVVPFVLRWGYGHGRGWRGGYRKVN